MKLHRPFLLRLLGLATATALPLALLLVHEARLGAQVARTDAVRQVQERSVELSQRSAEMLGRAQRFLEFLSRRPELLSLDEATCGALLRRMVRLDEQWANVGVVALDGRDICTSMGSVVGLPSAADSDWFEHAVRADGLAISEPIFGRVMQRAVLIVSLPLKDGRGRRIGLVGVALDLGRITEQFQRQLPTPGSVMGVFATDGRMLWRAPHDERALREAPSQVLSALSARQAGGSSLERGADGIERIYAVAPVPGFGWTAVVGMPCSDTDARGRAELLRQGLVGGLTAAVALCLAWLLAHRVAAPMESLARTARAVAEGRREARADVRGSAEFTAVAAEFNRMLDANEQSQTRLLAAEQRTARLAAIHEALSRTNQAIVRGLSEEALCDEICRICVDTGNAVVACIGFASDESIEPVACAGPDGIGLQQWPFDLVALYPKSLSLTAAALREGRRQVSNEFLHDARTSPLHAMARSLGLGSSAAFPLHRGGLAVGVLTLGVRDAGFFDDAMLKLFDEMAQDLSFALDGMARDAARAAAEREAQAGFARFRRVFDAMPVAATLVSRDGRLLDANRACAELVGISPEGLLGRPLSQIDIGIPEIEHSRYLAALKAGHGSVRRFEAHVRRADGSIRAVLVNGERTEVDGQDCVLNLLVDVSERIDADEARRARGAAEAANRAKTDFLSHMSHELRTPLNAVLGFAQLLGADPREPLSPHQRAHVERLEQAGWHLKGLIDDLLDVSFIEAGRLQVQHDVVAVRDVLDAAAGLCQAQAQCHHVSLCCGYREQATLHARADALRLRQVVVNLVSNAIKYNRPGGQVRIELAVTNDKVAIDVIDNGLGMTEEQVAGLFQPFNRLGRECGGEEGSGIGLALTRKLVQLMGGEIKLESAAGQGTRVRVTLDRIDAAAVATGLGRLADEADGAPGGRVLYIEDNPVNVLLVEECLRQWPDIEFMHAESGREGLAVARAHPPDLVLLDMHLPDTDGASVLRALRAEPATRRAPVVAVSASTMPDDVAGAMAAGAAVFISKPIDFNHFRAEVRRLLSVVGSSSARHSSKR